MSFYDKSSEVWCCDRRAMLRPRPKRLLTYTIRYIQYECDHCGKKGGLAITEPEARAMFNEEPYFQ